MMFVLGALALLQAASPPAVADQSSSEAWGAMSTPELAAELLPPPVAASVVRHEVTPQGVTFFTRARSMPDGFCERDLYSVSAGPTRTMTESADIRLGRCERSGATDFIHVTANPQLHVAQAKAAIRWLSNAIAAARAKGRLAFDVSCVSEGRPGLCANGGRKAVARLAIADLSSVDGAFTCQTSETEFAPRQASPAWDVRLARGAGRPRLTLTMMPPRS
jgi:hypothetical protein